MRALDGLLLVAIGALLAALLAVQGYPWLGLAVLGLVGLGLYRLLEDG